MTDEKAKKPYEQTVLDLRNLVQFGVPHTEGDFKTAPIIKPDIWNNNPRFSIISNHPAEAKLPGRFDKPLSKERFQIGLSPLIMNMFLSDIKKIATGELSINRRALRTKGYRDGKSRANGDKPEVTSTIAYGRNEKRQLYIQFKWWNREPNELVFKADHWHELEDIGEMSSDLDRQKFADKIAYEWADLLQALYRRIIFHNFEQNSFVPKSKGPEKPAEEKNMDKEITSDEAAVAETEKALSDW